MPSEIETYQQEMFQEALGKSEAEGSFLQEALFDIYTDKLIENGDISAAHQVFYSKPGKNNRTEKVSGYDGDPIESNDGSLSLLIADFDTSPTEVETLNRSGMEAEFTKLRHFVESALDDNFRHGLEETDPAFGLADLINTRWGKIDKLRMILITNKALSNRVDRTPSTQIHDKPVSYSVLDINRMQRLQYASEEREEMSINLLADYGGGIPVLPAHLGNEEYESYIAVLPAEKLAAIYDRWSDRLLEQNVRVFLQARGNVNQGIRNTLSNEPGMFFAYNNGITATAENIETIDGVNGKEISRLQNFQIVNGGQTTGSIYAASKAGTDLSGVFVQMKLSVISPDRSEEVVPKISQYANSQNRVNAADFFSNHPFHVRIEDFSRRMYVPAQGDSLKESKWFYERARGQYQNELSRRATVAQRTAYGFEFPKHQKVVKTDLAKFISVWDGVPHIVSRGAQKCFVDYAGKIGSLWEINPDQFNEMYFRHAIAKAIVFRETEKIVSSQPWYETGGYRANIVAYTIAKLSRDLQINKQVLDFEDIWRNQKITPGLANVIAIGATQVKEIILNPGQHGSRNISEWAKQEACWKRVEALEVSWPDSLQGCLLTAGEQKDLNKQAGKNQKELNGIEAQIAVTTAAPNLWANVKDWGNNGGFLTDTDRGVLKTAIDFHSDPSNTPPSDRQCERILEVLSRLQIEGCTLELTSNDQ